MNVDEDKLREIIRAEISGLETKLDSKLDVRFEASEAKTDARFKASEARTDARFKVFEDRIDARFESFEDRINTRFGSLENRVNVRFEGFELSLAKFFGQTHRYFDERFDTFEQTFSEKFSRLQTSVDGIVKRLDDDDVERTAANHQLTRHETWINELAKNTGTTLSTS